MLQHQDNTEIGLKRIKVRCKSFITIVRVNQKLFFFLNLQLIFFSFFSICVEASYFENSVCHNEVTENTSGVVLYLGILTTLFAKLLCIPILYHDIGKFILKEAMITIFKPFLFTALIFGSCPLILSQIFIYDFYVCDHRHPFVQDLEAPQIGLSFTIFSLLALILALASSILDHRRKRIQKLKRLASNYPKGAGFNKRMKNLHEVQPEEEGPDSKRTSADSLPILSLIHI